MKGSLFSVLLFCFVNEGLSSPIPSTMASTTPPLTTTPFTTQIPGCEYDGKIYPPGADIPELSGECYGASCSGDSGLFFIMHWDTFNCGVETSLLTTLGYTSPSTTPILTTPPPPTA